jgi:hypothetical protein
MTRKLASAVFLIVGVLIALGAYGHGFVGRLAVDAELNRYPIAAPVYTMLYVVWYFVSGCFFLFGTTIVWAWFRARRGVLDLLPIARLIGALFLVTGVAAIVYQHGNPFQLVFILEGALLLVCSFAWTSGRARRETSF